MQDPNTIHTVTLTGHDLTLEQLVAVCRCRAEVTIAPCAMEAMRASRALAEKSRRRSGSPTASRPASEIFPPSPCRRS